MRFNILAVPVAVCGMMLVAGLSHAFDTRIDEARIGGTWIDMPTPDRVSYHEYDVPGINAEILFAPLDFEIGDAQSKGFLREIFTPRVHLGTTIALREHTANSIYAGFTWHHDVGHNVYVETTFGGALHDGALEYKNIGGGKVERGMGSSLLFRESIAVGYNLSETMTLTLQLTHMSHAGLAGDDNSGQTDLALKIGQKF